MRLLLALLALTPARARALADADALLRQGEYADAVQALEELGVQRPDDPDVWSRLATARYRAGDHEGAARAFDAADRARGGTASDDAFNAGNAHWLAGRLEQALDRYDEALRRDPGHAGATANRQLLIDELRQRRQDAPEEPESGEDGEPADGSSDGDGAADAGASEDGEPGEPGGGPQGEAAPGEGPAPGAQPGEVDDDAEPGERDGSADAAEGPPPEGDGGAAGGASDQELEPEVSSDPVAPGELTDPGGDGGDGALAQDDGSGPLSEGQAERLLQGVEEGRPRVTLSGAGSDRPW